MSRVTPGSELKGETPVSYSILVPEMKRDIRFVCTRELDEGATRGLSAATSGELQVSTLRVELCLVGSMNCKELGQIGSNQKRP